MAGIGVNWEPFRLGALSTNCYLLWDDAKEAALIDTAGKPEVLINAIRSRDFNLRYIINTHGHYDHITCNAEIAELTGASILIHEADAAALTDNNLNLAGHFSPKFQSIKADRFLYDGDEIRLGELTLKIIHTPGHTPGGICLLVGNLLFTGDTLFAGSIGRSDLIGGNTDALLDSLHTKIWTLEEDYQVLPGHANLSSLNVEKEQNPWMIKTKTV